jgi:lipoyl(octanoyl) transferase
MKIVKLGLQPYLQTLSAMKAFTDSRNIHTEDELWAVEHPCVFTQGIAGKPEHLLKKNNIPLVQTDRGGQITYHAPGQLVVYCLLDLKRLQLGVKKTVALIETSIQQTLLSFGIASHLKNGAPGVYVDDAKIAALGLKVKNSKTYHGLSLNIDMDLSPFLQINPCGYQGLKVVQLSHFTDKINFEKITDTLCQNLINNVTKYRNKTP